MLFEKELWTLKNETKYLRHIGEELIDMVNWTDLFNKFIDAVEK